MKRKSGRLVEVFLSAVVCVTLAFTLSGCFGYGSSAPTKNNSSSSSTTTYPRPSTYGNQQRSTVPTPPTYEDNRWPTRNSQLLAIPQSSRWYNAWDSANTNCTIAGPVVRVYQARESAGMPIFIEIGAAYPNANSVALVVWAEQYDQFAQMINDVDDGGAWLSVSGYLSVYNGHLQFNAGTGYVEYRWWTHVS